MGIRRPACLQCGFENGAADVSWLSDEAYRYASGHYFNFRKTSIYGGSNEIQRNIITQLVLGL